jgi:hypothetical protein
MAAPAGRQAEAGLASLGVICTMVTNRTPLKSRRRRLTLDQMDSLVIGGEFYAKTFPSEAARKRAWEHHRDRILSQYAFTAFRPAAWWHYDAPIPRPADPNLEEAAVIEAGLAPPTTLAFSRTSSRRC